MYTKNFGRGSPAKLCSGRTPGLHRRLLDRDRVRDRPRVQLFPEEGDRKLDPVSLGFLLRRIRNDQVGLNDFNEPLLALIIKRSLNVMTS